MPILLNLVQIGGTAPWQVVENLVSSLQPMCRSSNLVILYSLLCWEFLISTCPLVKAKAIYDYTSTDANEATFTQGEEFSIVDTSDPVWWKADQGSVITLVPASYLELIEGKWNYRFPESFLFTLRRH